MRRQPHLEEAALAVLAVAAGHRADEPPAAPLQRGAVERAGLEAEHDLHDEQQGVAERWSPPTSSSSQTSSPVAPA